MNDVELIEALLEIRRQALELATAHEDDLDLVPAIDRSSARNLLHYVGLRQFDVRDVQRELAWRGLSSLGRSEAHVLASLDAVLSRLGVSCETDDEAPSFASSRETMIRHTDEALGAARRSDVRLMVTLPSEAASDAAFVGGLVAAGMDIARVNCAHDDAETWTSMVAHLRAHTPRPRVAFDLAGPKLRTGDLPSGPRVVKVRPRRGADGIVQRPGRVLLVDPDRTIESDIDSRLMVVPVNGSLLSDVAVGDDIVLRDTRERRRILAVVRVDAHGVEAICERTAYLATGLELECRREGLTIGRSEVGELPESDSFIRLETNDRLRIERNLAVGRAGAAGADGDELAAIGCDLDCVFDAVEVGHRIFIDDGTIEGVVEVVDADGFEVVICRPSRAKLKAQKGINLPDTTFVAPALTDDDRAALASIAPIADLVSLSFVRSVDDVVELRGALDDLGRPDLCIGVKIEHPAAFEALPQLLLYALQHPPMVVMLARGDLAMEVGFERLAELQEQVLWMCEAAHVPVIWATQVAESLAKNGVPTRAEVTDAAWASRADCVMLNKGPHIIEAIHFVQDVFARMHEHQDKGTSLLRRLSISDALDEQPHEARAV